MAKRSIVNKGESGRTTIDIRNGDPLISFEDDKVVISQVTPPTVHSRTKGRLRKEAEGRYKPEELGKLPKTRQEAIASGSKRFLPGVACPKCGVVAPRNLAHGCVECNRLKLMTRKPEENKAIFDRTPTGRTTKEAKRLLKLSPAVLDNQNEKTITDRLEAARRGFRFYFEANPCKKGHTDKVRYTSTGQCVVCHRALCLDWNKRKNQREVVVDNKNLMANPTVAIQDLVGSREDQEDTLY